MVGFDSWKKTMFLFCSANVFDPADLRDGLQRDPEGAGEFQARFRWVLREKPFTAQQWENEFDTSYDEDDELYAHLQAIYNYLFKNGPFDFSGSA